MATTLKKPVERVVEDTFIRGRPLVARMVRAGIEVKRKGERWTSAYMVPWDAIYYRGAALKATEKKAKRTPRLMRRGLLSVGA